VSDPDFNAMFQRLSNWGRWGPDDQLGTLNHLRPEHATRAMAEVTDGTAISCARTLSPLHPAGSLPLLHLMTATGHDARPTGKSIIADWLGFAIHGYGLTHLDAPSHEAWNGALYNGRDAGLVGGSGAGWGSVELATNRIVGRGVLLDAPRATGRAWLAPGTALTPDDLDACAAAQRVELRPGDILMVRTGRDARDGAPDLDLRVEGAAGLSHECLPWLREREVSVLVSDAVHDPLPGRFPACDTPIHAIGIVAMGLWLLDNAHLEELSAACARRSRWECLFVCPVLPIKRATGSPVNPLAFL
jgi:kynurenine formamidase